MTLHTDWKAGQTGHAAEHNTLSTRLLNVTDYPNVQAAVNAANGRTLYFPNVGGYTLTESLVIQPPAGKTQARLSILCDDPTGLVWRGKDGGSVVVSKGWKHARIEGLNVQVYGDGVTAWDITDPAGAGSSSHLTFENCLVSLLGTNGIGWRGGGLDSLGADISFLSFLNCAANSPDAKQGNIGWNSCHPNCLNWTWLGGIGAGLAVMVKAERGAKNGGASMFFYGLGSSHNLLEFRPGDAGAWSIFGGRFEVGNRFLECGQYDGGNQYPMNVYVIGADICKYQPADGVLFQMGTSGSLLLDNTRITENVWNANMIQLGGASAGYGSLIVRGGSIQTADDPFYTVGYGNWSARIEDVGRVDKDGYVVGRYASAARGAG